MKSALFAILTTLLLTACATRTPYRSDDPVDQALKICGLGYSAQVAALYKGAYAFATKQGSAEFEIKMDEYLKSQTTLMFEAMQPKGKDELEVVRKDIEANRACVLNLIEKNRPKTRSDLVYSCISDYKNRVGDTGLGFPKVKNWSVIESHSENSDSNLIVRAFVDRGRSSSFFQTFACHIRDNHYDDLVAVKE